MSKVEEVLGGDRLSTGWKHLSRAQTPMRASDERHSIFKKLHEGWTHVQPSRPPCGSGHLVAGKQCLPRFPQLGVAVWQCLGQSPWGLKLVSAMCSSLRNLECSLWLLSLAIFRRAGGMAQNLVSIDFTLEDAVCIRCLIWLQRTEEWFPSWQPPRENKGDHQDLSFGFGSDVLQLLTASWQTPKEGKQELSGLGFGFGSDLLWLSECVILLSCVSRPFHLQN